MHCLDSQLHKLQRPAIALLKEIGMDGTGCLVGSKLFLATTNLTWQHSLVEQHKRLLTAISRFQESGAGRITQISWSYPLLSDEVYQNHEFEVR